MTWHMSNRTSGPLTPENTLKTFTERGLLRGPNQKTAGPLTRMSARRLSGPK